MKLIIPSVALLLPLSLACNLGLELATPLADGPFELDSDAPLDTGSHPDGDADADTDADSDSDSDSDSDADADADSDADTDPVQATAPLLASFSIREDSGGRAVLGEFVGDDAEGDLRGGLAVLELDGDRYELDIPGDLDSFSHGGSSTFALASSGLLPGQTVGASLQLEDAAGLRSRLRSDTMVLAGFNHSLSEPDDNFSQADDIGRVDTPGHLSGGISRAANDGEAYTGDMDHVAFRVNRAATVTLSLSWDEAGADYDLRLGVQDRWLDTAVFDGTRQPEQITYDLAAGVTYYVAVAGWSGPGGAYEVEIEE